MNSIEVLFTELKGEIRTIASLQELRELWSGSNPSRISSPAEEVAHVFDDYQIDRILDTGRDTLKATAAEFQALREFRDAMNRYLEHIGPGQLHAISWQEVLRDPVWKEVSLAARKFIDQEVAT